MKKIFFLLLPFLLISCGGEKAVIEESSEIISDYVDVLGGTIRDAKELKNSMELDQEKLKNELNNLK